MNPHAIGIEYNQLPSRTIAYLESFSDTVDYQSLKFPPPGIDIDKTLQVGDHALLWFSKRELKKISYEQSLAVGNWVEIREVLENTDDYDDDDDGPFVPFYRVAFFIKEDSHTLKESMYIGINNIQEVRSSKKPRQVTPMVPLPSL